MNMNAQTTPNDVSLNSRRGVFRRWRAVLIGATIVILAGGAWFFADSLDTQPHLPDVAAVRAIKASFYDRDQNAKIEFQVPREHWNSIYSALLPAQRVDNTLKWPGFGELEFELSNGDSFLVSLYNPSHETGAFSAGPTIDRRRYYRGGDSRELEQVLTKASKSTAGNPGAATR